MDKVLREMIREVVNASINTMVNQYFRKRQLRITDADDTGDDVLERIMDPLSRAGKQVLDDYIRRVIRGILKEELNYQPNNGK